MIVNSEVSFDMQALPKISPECAKNYRTHKDTLLYALNSTISKDTLLQEIISTVAHSVIYDLHRYHVALLSSVLELGNYELLVRSLPWEYRAYHNQGLEYDYFLHIFRFWQQAIEHVFDKNCAKELKEIYSWLITQHEHTIILSQNEPSNENHSTYALQQNSLIEKLIDGNHMEVMKLCQKFLAEENSLITLFNSIIQPAMVSIGLLWERGKITSAIEHLATAIITKTLSNLYPGQTLNTPVRGTAIVTAAPNEYHELGAWMVATALESDGWNVHYLGANTPAKDLLTLLKDTNADILAISAVVPFHLDEIRDLIKDIKSDGKLEKIKVMIGGRAFDSMPEIAAIMGADAHLRDADDAIRKAREWQSN